MTNYHAYLIRLWRDDEQQPWRAELVSPQSGEARRFATPEQAYAYLQQELEQEQELEGPSSSSSRSRSS
jgi:hypothetical protein